MELVFTDPKYLWLLVGIFLLFISHHISIGWNRKHAMKFANFDAIAKVTRHNFFPKSYVPLIIRALVLVFLVLSAAGFGFWYSGNASGLDYIIAIDSSGSMLAEDYEPNRLAAAKDSAISFIDLLDVQTNVGIISFAGTSFISQGLTSDKSKVKGAVESIDIISVGGTAIGDAIVLATNSFKVSEVPEMDRGRSVILLTDGQSNVGITVEGAAEYAVQDGVVVHALGIGTEDGGIFTEDLIASQLDATTLQLLAEKTGGKFYFINNEQELETAYADIFSSVKTQVFFDARIYLIILSFALLLLEWTLSNTRYKTII
jgi:Ca-activated chloride channel homolog